MEKRPSPLLQKCGETPRSGRGFPLRLFLPRRILEENNAALDFSKRISISLASMPAVLFVEPTIPIERLLAPSTNNRASDPLALCLLHTPRHERPPVPLVLVIRMNT